MLQEWTKNFNVTLQVPYALQVRVRSTWDYWSALTESTTCSQYSECFDDSCKSIKKLLAEPEKMFNSFPTEPFGNNKPTKHGLNAVFQTFHAAHEHTVPSNIKQNLRFLQS